MKQYKYATFDGCKVIQDRVQPCQESIISIGAGVYNLSGCAARRFL